MTDKEKKLIAVDNSLKKTIEQQGIDFKKYSRMFVNSKGQKITKVILGE